ncbi:ArnT family glycosyltransferase [Patescibacteria group bacterium]
MFSPKAKIKKILETKIFWILFLGLIVLVFWFPTRDTPYWWDSAGYVVHAARYYVNTNFSSIFLPSDSVITAFAHPPLFVFSLALVWKIFGESLLISHLFYLIFILLAVIFTYLLGKKVANFKNEITNNLIGFSAAILLFFSPVFLAQTGIVYPEIPIAAFSVMAIYFFLDKRVKWYLLSASLLLFTKESSIVIILAILASILIQFSTNFLKNRKGDFKLLAKNLFLYGSPIFLLIIWFIWHKIATGWMFVMPYYQEQVTKQAFSFWKTFHVLKFFFWEQGRFIITIFIISFFSVAIFKIKLRKKILKQKKLIPISLVILAVLFLFCIVDFLHRYIIFGLPFLYIIFLCLFGLAFQRRRTLAVVLALLILLPAFFSQWDNHREINNWHFPPLEENLEYLDVIDIGKEMVSFVEKSYPEAVVYTAFPSDYMLSESFQHYVSKSIEVHNCKNYRDGDKIDLIVFHFLSPPEINCLQIMQKLKFLPVKTFEKNGKKMEIYKNPNS